MNSTRKAPWIAGWVLHGLIGAAMLMSGGMKVFITPSAEMLEEMKKTGLADQMTMIGVGEMACAVLLLVPRTMSLGVWLTSGFWGGAICLHMSKGESYILQSVFLLLTWLGAYLRDPRELSSFKRVGQASVEGPA